MTGSKRYLAPRGFPWLAIEWDQSTKPVRWEAFLGQLGLKIWGMFEGTHRQRARAWANLWEHYMGYRPTLDSPQEVPWTLDFQDALLEKGLSRDMFPLDQKDMLEVTEEEFLEYQEDATSFIANLTPGGSLD